MKSTQHEFICEVCGKQFSPNYNICKDKILKYCSRDCYSRRIITKDTRDKISRANKGQVRNPNQIIVSVCEVCGQSFRHNHLKKRKYCSYKCGSKIYAKRNGSMKRDNVIERNRDKDFIKKVSEGVSKYHQEHPVKEQRWYKNIYGENYQSKSPYLLREKRGAWLKLSHYLTSKYSCHRCGVVEKLNVHHIIPYSFTQDSTIENLVVLCKSCHKIVEMENIRMNKTFNGDWELVRCLYKTNLEDNGMGIRYE
jgi:5-methylcytosine-specific restriction endonuclease McrA